MRNSVNELVRCLYLSAYSHPPEEFKAVCFEIIKQELHFDSGLWITRSDMFNKINEYWSEDAFLSHQPEKFIDNYFQLASNVDMPDPLNLFLTTHSNQFYSLWDVTTRDKWEVNAYYTKHCRLFGVENALAALVAPTELSSTTHAISLYRENKKQIYTEQEKQLVNELLPNVIHAFRYNLLNSFVSESNKKQSYRGILDRFGVLIEAEQGFINIAQQQGLLKENQIILPELQDIASNLSKKGSEIDINAEFRHGLVYMDISNTSRLEKLTKRQLEVCRFMVKGLGNKEIASYLNISANTVNNHVRTILQLLQVPNRQEAAIYLLRQDLG